ncbi:MAG: hypothetical protein ACK42D_02285 [Candidatus Paceibacteria bacterium]
MFLRKKTDAMDEVVEPLARSQRKLVFFSLIAIFVVAVPAFVFHAIGYRYDFFNPTGSIISTGALYVTVPVTSAQIYVNERAVRDARTFRRASYIQYLLPGMHRVHVSSDGLHTWVKELPVYPHIVTEAEAFLLPVHPQLRLIAEYVDTFRDISLVNESQFEFITSVASTTLPVEVAVSSDDVTSGPATTTTRIQVPKDNPEYAVLEEMFATSSLMASSLAGRAIDTARQVFQFQTTPGQNTATSDTSLENGATTSTATTTRVRSQLTLFERGGDIFVSYNGNSRDIPYYFCVPQANIASTTEVYGAHVMQGVRAVLAATNDDMVTETGNSNRICRHEIMIDRQGMEVYSFDFINVGSEAVILHREDGIFVTEIDDRSWQNTQKIYGATVKAMVVENNRIYIKDEQEFYAELLLTLIAGNN